MKLSSFVVVFLCLIGSSLGQFTRSYQDSTDIGHFHIEWSIVDSKLQLGLRVSTLGWIGFGIADPDSGSMAGADMLIGYVTNGQAVVQDKYAMGFAPPKTDDCNDWKLVSGKEDLQNTYIEVDRALDTKDEQDRAIGEGPTKVVIAWGNNDAVSYHGQNRHLGSVSFIPVASPELNTTYEIVDIHVGDYLIPAEATSYTCVTLDLPTFDSDVHVIRIEPLIDPETNAYVHHIVVHVCESNTSAWFEQYYNNMGLCYSPLGDPSTQCSSIFFAWAHGVDYIDLPIEAGYRLGPTGTRWIAFQMHYDNRNLYTGLIDNSGIRLFYTYNLRKYDAGVMTWGDVATTGVAVPPAQSRVEYEYSCPSECTSTWEHDITVFVSFLHMHELGKQIYASHWRGNESLGIMAQNDFFAFGNQLGQEMNLVIKRGDRTNLHCIYDSTSRADPTPFGGPSDWEMCMQFVMYYPKLASSNLCGYYRYRNNGNPMNISVCGVSNILLVPNPTAHDPEEFGDITFGTAPSACQAPTTDDIVIDSDPGRSNAIFWIVPVGLLLALGIAGGVVLYIKKFKKGTYARV